MRIKFHVDNETRKLNEHWQLKIHQLQVEHERKMEEVKKFYDEGRCLLSESIKKKCRMENDKLLAKAIESTRREAKQKCAEAMAKELVVHTAEWEEKLRNTLAEREANDGQRMAEVRNQCLKAMDVQHQLLICRQITELMHMMAWEKQTFRVKMLDMRNEYASIIGALERKLENAAEKVPATCEIMTQANQSKSIIEMWREFLKQLNAAAADAGRLSHNEQSIYEAAQCLDEKLASDRDQHDDVTAAASATVADDELFIIHQERMEAAGSVANHQSVNDDECLGRNVMPRWMEVDEEEEAEAEAGVEATKSPADVATFASSIFHRMSMDSTRSKSIINIPEIASSIIRLVKDGKDSKNVESLLEEAFAKAHPVPVKESEPIPALKHRDDSVELVVLQKVLSQRSSMESHSTFNQLLAAVDSLELLNSRRTSDRSATRRVTLTIGESVPESNLPPYMLDPSQKSLKRHHYQRMSESDWRNLEEELQLPPATESKRESAVTFDDSNRNSAKPASFEAHAPILKNPLQIDISGMDQQQQKALEPVVAKCQDALKNMKVESILNLLCNDPIQLPFQ